MESTVLSVGKSVLSGALGYASSAAAEEVALQLGIQHDHAFIRNELEMMQAFLMTAHEEQHDNKVVKTWVKQVRDVSYNVEDCLQDFAVRLEKLSWWRIPCTLLDRRRVAMEMKELRAQVEDVSQRNTRYSLIKGSAASKPAAAAGQSAIAGETMSGVDEARRQQDEAKGDLIRLINKKDDDLSVIAVWGTSGDLGETSIVKRAYEHLKIHKKFECHAWIRVTHPFNQMEFLLSIMRQFFVNSLHEAGGREKETIWAQVLRKMGMEKEDGSAEKTERDLADAFKRYVNDKSYLIVLDYRSTIEEWDQIKTLFPNSKKGSRIIVCTEQVEVANLCVGLETVAPEHKQLFADQTLYAFYKKGSKDGTDSRDEGSSSHAATISNNVSADGKILTRTETMVAALKESRLIGREEEKSDIIKLISNEESQQLEVISLWGMGGIGKTTIVRDVYQSQDISSKFEKRACVTIMRPFNCEELLKSLAAQLGCNIVKDLAGHLERKKYLIVLDDLSSTTEWDVIMPHFRAAEIASRIIVTTRVENIAKHCSKKHKNIYKLQTLGYKDAHDLFTGKVFGRITDLDEQYPELVEQANLILKKCNGLPLAIVTIGGFLANQPKTVLEWRKLNEHIGAELEMNPELGTIIAILNKSYDGLPYDLKSCFLYLPIFPEDYKVSRRRLIRRWTAEGYSREMRGKSAEEIADSYFTELINRSMILPSEEPIHSRKGIDSCQVHDMMREISISKSIEENLVLRLDEGCSINTQGTTRHLAISSDWERDQIEFDSIVDLSRVRSITVFGKWRSFFITGKMRLLRVLDLEGSSDLYDHHLGHIGKLLHLKYLSLRGCHHISHIPDSFGNLRQLETLDVRDTGIVKLPNTIISLRKLNYLRVGSKAWDEKDSYEESMDNLPKLIRNRLCMSALSSIAACYLCSAVPSVYTDGANRRDVCTAFCCAALPSAVMRLDIHGVLVPGGMRKMKALHTLGVVNIAHGKFISRDMRRLTRLRKLGVTGINKRNGEEFCSAVAALSRLESLSMRSEGEPGLSACLDGLSSPPENLQSLKLYGNLVKLPKWIEGLKNLVKLKLRSSKILEHADAMQVLGKLQNLAILILLEDSFEGKEEVRLNFHREGFLSLVLLQLDGIPKLKSVKFEETATPKLEVVQFSSSSSDPEVGLFSGLPSLPSLKEFMLNSYSYNYHHDFMKDLTCKLAENPNGPVLKSF